MNPSTTTRPLSVLDKMRIAWVGARYDLWLDLNCVPRKQRNDLKNELKANLSEASAEVGLATGLHNLGNLRSLAAETARDGQLRSRWLAGWVAALTTLAISFAAFVIPMLYYTEGVLDSGALEPVQTSLFPYYGSSLVVDPSQGIAWTFETGPLPVISAIVVWILVAKPWRARAGQTQH